MLIVNFLLALGACVLVAYVLALYDICFTLGHEGAAKAVVKGQNQFDHMLMWWRGYYINDPRPGRKFDRRYRIWEVIPVERNPNAQPSLYAWWQIHWRFFELFGIYWYGFYPFKKIYLYEFAWTEESTDEKGVARPLRRQEYTDFIYVKNFSYWVKLEGAEDKDNQALDIDHLLTILINNPYWALFRIEDWLNRVTADANNKAKVYVACRSFDDIKREDTQPDTEVSEFSRELLELNENLVTEPYQNGTRVSYGVTITAASMVNVAPSGLTAPKVTEALAAKRIAELQAEATIATAKGDATAARERAKGEADAIETVYRKVSEFENGVTLQHLDAIRQAAKSPGSTVIWANNPLGDLINHLRGQSGGRQNTTPPTPASPS